MEDFPHNVSVKDELDQGFTHRLLSSSFLGLGF